MMNIYSKTNRIYDLVIRDNTIEEIYNHKEIDLPFFFELDETPISKQNHYRIETVINEPVRNNNEVIAIYFLIKDIEIYGKDAEWQFYEGFFLDYVEAFQFIQENRKAGNKIQVCKKHIVAEMPY
jgi:hypothetical protein